MYVLRHMVEKRLEVRGSLGLVFDDLERAYDTIPREMVMVTLRWMGASEAEVRMAESTYEMTTAKSVGGRGRIRGVLCQNWTEMKRAEPASVHYSNTGPHQQEDDHEGRHEHTPLCGRPGTGGEWQTGATGDTVGYQTLSET